MLKARFPRRLLCSVGAILALLSVLGSFLYPNATAQAASTRKGLDLRQLYSVRPLWKYAMKASAGQIPPCLSSAVPPRCYSPQQIRNAYNIQSLLNAGITGKGHTIILIDGSTSPTLTADVHLYDQLYGLKDPKLKVLTPFGVPAFDPNAYVETALDVEVAHSIAPDAAIDLVLADTSTAQSPGDFLSILLGATRYAIDHNLGDVISQSFGIGESCAGSAYLLAEQQVFAEARAKHITVLASSGDNGAAVVSCNGPQITLAKGVNLPAADPLATAVGGTSLDAALNTGKYASEATWNEPFQGATGGGFSSIFPRPDYQNGIPGTGATRGMPDLAFDADPMTGVPIVVSVFGGTQIIPVGGTSVGSPAWAGIVALANQSAGRRLGFLNPALYQIVQSGSFSKAFYDITTGNNMVTVFDQNGNPVTIQGYNAGSGWDPVTGVGTPKVSSLAALLG